MTYSHRVSHLDPKAPTPSWRAPRPLKPRPHILHLEIGQPDFPTWPNISLAGIRAIVPDRRATIPCRYPPATGGHRRGGRPPPRHRGPPGAGGRGAWRKPGLFFPTLALVEPGDEGSTPTQASPPTAAMIGVAGGVPVPVPLREGTSSSSTGSVRPAYLRPYEADHLDSPANPTGG